MNYNGISLEAYSGYIIALKARGLSFLSASDFLQFKSDIFWRHDIDLSIDASLTLAEIEKQLEVVSTYYIDLNTFFYNALSISNIEKINCIAGKGHDIGIHFDARLLKSCEHNELHDKIFEYSEMFSRFFGITQKFYVSPSK